MFCWNIMGFWLELHKLSNFAICWFCKYIQTKFSCIDLLTRFSICALSYVGKCGILKPPFSWTNIISVLKYLHTVNQENFAPFVISRRFIPQYKQLTVEIENCHLFKVDDVRKKPYVQKHVRTCVGGQMTSRLDNWTQVLATYYAHWPPI